MNCDTCTEDTCDGCTLCCIYHENGGNEDYVCGPTEPNEETESLRELLAQMEHAYEVASDELDALNRAYDAMADKINELKHRVRLTGKRLKTSLEMEEPSKKEQP